MSMSAKKLATSKSKSKAVRAAVVCAVCQSRIIDGKEDALLCEGDCGQWLHRGCASVPPVRYKELSTSDEPFVCLSCSNLHLKQVITELSSTVHTLKEELKEALTFREKFTSLTNEVSELKLALDTISKQQSNPLLQRKSESYAAATKSHPRARHLTSKPQKLPTRTTSGPATQRDPAGSDNYSGEYRAKIKVEGARRIWGTIKTCSPRAISSTISKLVPPNLQLSIKRKTKQLSNNKTLWWFVLHGSESDLCILDNEWGKVHDQTHWKLQACFMPSPSDTSTHTNLPKVTTLPENNNVVPSTPVRTQDVATPVPTASTQTVVAAECSPPKITNPGQSFLSVDPNQLTPP